MNLTLQQLLDKSPRFQDADLEGCCRYYDLQFTNNGKMSGWMTIVLDKFFPCRQYKLIKLIKVMKSVLTEEEFIIDCNILIMQFTYLKESNLAKYFYYDYNETMLNRNMALLNKEIKECTDGKEVFIMK